MKKIFTIAIAALAFAGNAQASSYDGFTFGNDADRDFTIIGQFGMNISNFRMNEVPWGDMDAKAGFNIGLHAEYVLPQCYGIYLNAGLEYSMKGAKDRIGFDVDDMLGLGATFISRPMYLQLPIHVGYRYNAMDDLGIYADFGPYFALGTNGKNIVKMDDFSEDVRHNFFMNDKDGNLFYKIQRPEFGLGFRIGAEYARHYNFILSCDWGITDMLTQSQKHTLVTNTGIKNPTVKNFAAGLTFGYRF